MSLKVFDLECASGHIFEGWFSGENSFDKQAEQGLLTCPVCGGSDVHRKLSAPRINLGKAQPDHTVTASPAKQQTHEQAQAATSDVAAGSAKLAQMQAQLLRHMREMVRSSEDVGDRFAQEARKIHSGEAQERLIRGQATIEEQRELLEEGIGVMPVPDFLNDDKLQ